MSARRRDGWTEDEDRLVIEYGPTHGPSWPGWADLLPRRSRQAVKARMYTLGVHLTRDARIAVAQANYARRSPSWTVRNRIVLMRHVCEMIEQTGHSLDECYREAARLLDEHRRHGVPA